MHGCRGACVVAGGRGGVLGWQGGVWLPGGVGSCLGVCMFAGGHAWLHGGMHGWGHA